jgi:GNAT superfamily N-acetyltransferase
MALIIRPALENDAHAIGTLAKQFAEYLRALGDTTEFRLTAEAYLRDGFGPDPAFLGFVAEELGKVIGYLLYHPGYDSDRAARNVHIVDLYVERDARRRGLGKALMTAVAGAAVKAGAEEMIWSVYHRNTEAERFYEAVGAVRISDVFFMKLAARTS